MTVAAPASVGVVLQKSLFNIIGRPQAVADFSTTRGVRISGTGLTNFWAVQLNDSDNPVPAFSALGPDGRNRTYYVPLIPGNIDPRLGIFASTFQYFAFRSLTLTYVPACGTNTVNSIAFGVSQDPEMYMKISTPTQQQILEVNSATLTPFWQTASISYNHSGSRTWNTSLPNSGETGNVSQFYQAQIVGSVNTVGDFGVRGYFYVNYVVDLYEPAPTDFNRFTGAVNPDSGYIGTPPCRRRESDDEKEDTLPCGPTELVRSDTMAFGLHA